MVREVCQPAAEFLDGRVGVVDVMWWFPWPGRSAGAGEKGLIEFRTGSFELRLGGSTDVDDEVGELMAGGEVSRTKGTSVQGLDFLTVVGEGSATGMAVVWPRTCLLT